MKAALDFAAIDFETADAGPDSACALGIVRVRRGRVAKRFHRLIRPPRASFLYTYIHGITWGQVCLEPDFAHLWPQIAGELEGVKFLAAHNASFDRRVLEACCRAARIEPPRTPFVCTVQLARKTWSIFPTQLPMVCRKLKIPLNHHEALSDAEACARIVLAAGAEGWTPGAGEN
ncbi:MAG: 3'-5' exonuclease [Elusimicrobia bacterium]|nr:3'-5' exonuclease [Elusimicrobiota bacterium]